MIFKNEAFSSNSVFFYQETICTAQTRRPIEMIKDLFQNQWNIAMHWMAWRSLFYCKPLVGPISGENLKTVICATSAFVQPFNVAKISFLQHARKIQYKIKQDRRSVMSKLTWFFATLICWTQNWNVIIVFRLPR